MCSVTGMQTSNGSRASSWRRQPLENLLCSDPSNPPCTRSGLRFPSPSLPPSLPSASLPPFPSPIYRCWPGVCQKDIDAEGGRENVRGGWEEGNRRQLPTSCFFFLQPPASSSLLSSTATFPLSPSSALSMHTHVGTHTEAQMRALWVLSPLASRLSPLAIVAVLSPSSWCSRH